MANEVSIRLKAKDEASSGINKVAGNINSLSKKISETTKPISNLSKAFKNLNNAAPGLIVIGQAFSKVKQSISQAVNQMKEWEKAWAEADATVQRIDFATKINKQLNATTEELTKFSEDLSSKLRGAVAADDINSQIAKLSFDKTTDQIKEIVTVATDLSAALGVDLDTAVTQLNQTFSGSIGTLGKYFPELKKLSSEGLIAGDALEILKTKVNGVAESMSDSVSGSMASYQNAIDNLKEALGSLASNLFDPIRVFVTNMVNTAIKAIDKINNKIAEKKAIAEAESQFKNKKGVWSAGRVSAITADPTSAQAADAKRLLEVYQKKQTEINQLTNDRKNTTVISTVKNIDNRLMQLREDLGENETDYNSRIEDLKAVIAAYEETTKFQVEGLQYSQGVYDRNPALTGGSTPAPATASAPATTSAPQSNAIIPVYDTALQSLLPELEQALTDLRQSITANLGDLGVILEGVSAGTFSGLSLSTQILSTLFQTLMQNQSVSETFNFISTIIQSFVATINNALTNLFQPIATILKQVGHVLGQIVGPVIQAIANLLKPVMTFVSYIMTFVSQIWEAIGGAVLGILNVIIGVVTSVLELLNPVAAAMSYVVDFISALFKTIQWFADMAIYYLGTIIDILNGVKGNPYADKKHEESIASIWKEAFSKTWSERLAQFDVNAGGLQDFTAGTETSMGTTNSASYTAARDIIINISFDHSFVNGDATQIAIMLKNEMEYASKLGY